MIGRMLPDKLVNDLATHIKDALEPQILQRGLDYYEGGRVKHIRITDDGRIRAQVRGATFYDVVLDVNHFYTGSRCNCPYDGICKHMAATFFAVYAHVGSPKLFTQDFRRDDEASPIVNYSRLLREPDTTTLPQEGQTEPGNGVVQQQEGAGNLSQRPPIESLSPTSHPSEWVSFFRHLFADLSTYYSGLSWFVANCRVIAEAQTRDWEPQKQNLFLVYFYVYALVHLQEFQRAIPATDSDKLRFVNPASAFCTEKMEHFLNMLQVDASTPIPALYIEPLVQFLRERTFSLKDTNSTWKEIYRLLWTRLMSRQRFLEEELAWIETQVEGAILVSTTSESATKGTRRLVAQDAPNVKRCDQIGLGHAKAYLLVLMGEDTEAATILSNLPYVEVAQFIQTCRFCAENDDWERVLFWLRWFGSIVYQLEWRAQQDVMQYWKEIANHGAPLDECVRMLRGWTAHGRAFYASFLIEHGLYKEWVNFQLLSDRTPYEIGSGELRMIERHRPELLLPLYHQSIARCVLQKNRQAYRTAARMMRKLRTLYKKVKQPEKFEAYLQAFTAEHARLRALQDELRRGKLIS